MKFAFLTGVAIFLCIAAFSQSISLANINPALKDTVLIGIKNKVVVTGLSTPIKSASAERATIKIDGNTIIVNPIKKGPLTLKLISDGHEFTGHLVVAYASDPSAKKSKR